MLRQLLYVSVSRPSRDRIELDPIYDASRHNNAIDGITGLLFSDGYRFVQVLEGSDEAVGATMERILADPRHERIEVLRDETVPAREFGYWAMADRRRGEGGAEFDARMALMLRRASPATRDRFLDLVAEPAA